MIGMLFFLSMLCIAPMGVGQSKYYTALCANMSETTAS